MLQCPNRLRYVILDVLVAPCRENNNFVFFKVQHANRGWTKYSNNNYPFFIWHLECNERRRINNMILNFFAPKLRVETTHRSRSDFTWLDWSAAAAFKTFSRPVSQLKERKRLFFPLFFWEVWSGQQSTLTWSTLTGGPSRCPELTRRPKKVRWAAQAVQRPIKAPFCLILTSFHSFLWLLTSQKFSGATYELSGSGFFTSVCCFSFFYTWGQCLSFLLSSFFCQMLVAILLGMHASAYFIFGIFISFFFFFCHDICPAILGECIYFLLFVCVIWVCKYAGI